MSLKIDFGMFENEKPAPISSGLLIGDTITLMPQSTSLAETIALVAPNATVLWVSESEWCMHELLVALLSITGAAEVTISSYAMSETPTRIISKLKDSGMITKLSMLLDNRVDVRSAGSFQLCQSICDRIKLIKTHAKVTVITNAKWQLAVIGSANYTDNERYESGVIIANATAVDMQLLWMNKAFAND